MIAVEGLLSGACFGVVATEQLAGLQDFDMASVGYLAACFPPIEMKLSLLRFPLFASYDLPRAAKSLLTDLRDFLLGLL